MGAWLRLLVVVQLVFIFLVCAIEPHSERKRGHYILNEHILGDIPQILIIGAAKCGTTSLHELLTYYPEICRSGAKEKHFFDSTLEDFRGGLFALQKYRQEFRKDDPNQDCRLFIDSTPAYIRSRAIDNMNISFSPRMMSMKKFILVLREPAERECSWYQHFARGCVKHLEFLFETNKAQQNWSRTDACIGSKGMYCEKIGCLEGTTDLNRENYLSVIQPFSKFVADRSSALSYFDEQLSHWLKFVRRDQIFIISFPELITNTTAVVRKLTEFLGLTRGLQHDHKLPENNVNDMKKIAPCDCETLDSIRQTYVDRKTIENTLQIINMPNRSPLEPWFPPSTFSYRRKCVSNSSSSG